MTLTLSILIAACGGGDVATTTPEPDATERTAPKLTLGTQARDPDAPVILPGSNDGSMEPPDEAITEDQCDQLEEGGPVPGPACLSGELKCGDTLIAHTLGGGNEFDSAFYERQHCTPGTSDHDGGDERAYVLDMPDGEWVAQVVLDSPCADLDVAGMRWSDETRCPTADDTISQCDMWPKPRGKRETLELVSQKAQRWLIVVEGKDRQEGLFALTVQCRPGLN